MKQAVSIDIAPEDYQAFAKTASQLGVSVDHIATTFLEYGIYIASHQEISGTTLTVRNINFQMPSAIQFIKGRVER